MKGRRRVSFAHGWAALDAGEGRATDAGHAAPCRLRRRGRLRRSTRRAGLRGDARDRGARAAGRRRAVERAHVPREVRPAHASPRLPRRQAGPATAPAGSSPRSDRSNPACCPGTSLDLSENHMADFQASRLHFEGRAPSTISTAYVARWEGPVLERDDPYPRPGQSREGLRAVRHVQDVLFLPSQSSPHDNAAIKWAVMSHGAVDATMAYEHYDFNAATSAYYSRGTDVDHHVCIVGWNDGVLGRALPAPPARPGRVPHQEQLGHVVRAGRLLLDLLLRPLARDLAGGVRAASRARATTTPSTSTTRSAGRGASASSRTTAWFAARYTSGGDGSVAAASFYTPKAGRDLRGPRRADARRDRRGAGRRRGHAGGRRLPHGRAGDAGAGDGRRRLRRRRPPHDARIAYARSRSSIRPSCWPRARPSRGRSSAATGPPGRTCRTRPGFAASDVCLKAFVRLGRGRRRRRAPRARSSARRLAAAPASARPLHAHRPGVLERQRRGQALAARRPRPRAAAAPHPGGARQRARHVALRRAQAARGPTGSSPAPGTSPAIARTLTRGRARGALSGGPHGAAAACARMRARRPGGLIDAQDADADRGGGARGRCPARGRPRRSPRPATPRRPPRRRRGRALAVAHRDAGAHARRPRRRRLTAGEAATLTVRLGVPGARAAQPPGRRRDRLPRRRPARDRRPRRRDVPRARPRRRPPTGSTTPATASCGCRPPRRSPSPCARASRSRPLRGSTAASALASPSPSARRTRRGGHRRALAGRRVGRVAHA